MARCEGASPSAWTPGRAQELLQGESPREIVLGLERIATVLDRLGNPERRVPAVLVAGTNGKGSTCAFLDSILRCAGWRTGLYSSPHLVDWPERIRVDGRCIAWSELARRLGEVEEARAGIPLTTFERLTAAALLQLAREQPDVAILEVGLGGRLDATRVVRPRLSLITSIGLDHMELLGNTVQAVAGEKAGIIEPGVTALTTAAEPAFSVLAQRARELAAPLHAVSAAERGEVRWAGRWIRGLQPGLAGEHQWENMALAVAAALTMQAEGWLAVPDEAVRRGVREVCWPGRLQRLPGEPLAVLDGAHNPPAARALARSVSLSWPDRPLHLLFGILADKDVAGTLQPLLPLAARLTFVRPAGPRGLDPLELLPLAGGVPATVSPLPPAETLQRLRASEPPGTLILATGSLRLVGDLLAGLDRPAAEN